MWIVNPNFKVHDLQFESPLNSTSIDNIVELKFRSEYFL